MGYVLVYRYGQLVGCSTIGEHAKTQEDGCCSEKRGEERSVQKLEKSKQNSSSTSTTQPASYYSFTSCPPGGYILTEQRGLTGAASSSDQLAAWTAGSCFGTCWVLTD